MCDDLPANFYKAQKAKVKVNYANQPATSSQSREGLTGLPGQDPNMPANFYKHHTTNKVKPTSSQSTTSNKRNQTVNDSKPSDPDTFDLETRLKRLSTTKTSKPPSTGNLEKRLEKLQGLDKPIPTVDDLEARLNGLKGKKVRKMTPLVRISSMAATDDPEALIKEVEEEAGIGKEFYFREHKTKPTAELTPEQLLEMVKNEPNTDSDSDDSTHDDFSSDLEDVLTESDDDLISDDEEGGKKKKLTAKEWKALAREMIKEAEREAANAEKAADDAGKMIDKKFNSDVL